MGQREGFGVARAEGATYAGQWSGGQRHGQGTLIFEGGIYEGQWVYGAANGQAMVSFSNGDVFRGSYEKNQKSGHGIYCWADGAAEEGEYVQGVQTGLHRWRRGDQSWLLEYQNGTVVHAQQEGPQQRALSSPRAGSPVPASRPAAVSASGYPKAPHVFSHQAEAAPSPRLPAMSPDRVLPGAPP